MNVFSPDQPRNQHSLERMSSSNRIAELEKMVDELNRKVKELENQISRPEYTSPEREMLIKSLNSPGVDLHRVAGHISESILDAYERTDVDQTARTLVELINNTNMWDSLGLSLKKCYSERSPSYNAWLAWKSVCFN